LEVPLASTFLGKENYSLEVTQQNFIGFNWEINQNKSLHTQRLIRFQPFGAKWIKTLQCPSESQPKPGNVQKSNISKRYQKNSMYKKLPNQINQGAVY